MWKNLIVAGLASFALSSGAALAENAPGITDSEIKIGQTMPYSGPASAYSAVGKAEMAFFAMVNDNGGVNGRRINLISLDDGYSPPKTLEQTRKLIEQENVAFIFGSLGTPTNSATEKYLNERRIPQLLIATGAHKFGDYQHFPWTMAFGPSYRIEARIYGKYLLKEKPDAKIALLYQNDDFGRDYVNGLRDVFGDRYGQLVVKEATYEVSDPTVDSQVLQLQASGADVLVIAATPKFAAQTIRKVAAIGWKPLRIICLPSASIGSVYRPAGVENAIGVVTALPYKDQTDPRWNDDPGMKRWVAFMNKYLPSADKADAGYFAGYGFAQSVLQVLKRCGTDLSRENIMRQATNLKSVELDNLLPGVTLNTSPTNYYPIGQMQMYRFDGQHQAPFGEIISVAGS